MTDVITETRTFQAPCGHTHRLFLINDQWWFDIEHLGTTTHLCRDVRRTTCGVERCPEWIDLPPECLA